MGKILKFIVGVAAMPIAFGVTYAFYNNVTVLKELAGIMRYFAWGAASYVILHLLFYRPTYLYVLGHEAVHAGAAWIFGGKIKSFKVSEDGGGVGTDKTNVVVELSPYFVPIYAIVISVIYFIIASSYNVNGAVFLYLIGFALAFHMVSTIEVMKIRQPDIVKSGYFFSIIMVYALNIVVISLIFELLFPSFSEKRFLLESWRISKDIYVGAIGQLFF